MEIPIKYHWNSIEIPLNAVLFLCDWISCHSPLWEARSLQLPSRLSCTAWSQWYDQVQVPRKTNNSHRRHFFCRKLEAKIPKRTSRSTSARDSETQSNKANTCNKPHTKTIYIIIYIYIYPQKKTCQVSSLCKWCFQLSPLISRM